MIAIRRCPIFGHNTPLLVFLFSIALLSSISDVLVEATQTDNVPFSNEEEFVPAVPSPRQYYRHAVPSGFVF